MADKSFTAHTVYMFFTSCSCFCLFIYIYISLYRAHSHLTLFPSMYASCPHLLLLFHYGPLFSPFFHYLYHSTVGLPPPLLSYFRWLHLSLSHSLLLLTSRYLERSHLESLGWRKSKALLLAGKAPRIGKTNWFLMIKKQKKNQPITAQNSRLHLSF